MALSTAGTFLMYSTDDGLTYTKLVDIVNYPDMGSAPAKLDTTDLSQTIMKTFINDIQEAPELSFECNYVKATYDTINALTDEYLLAVYFGDDTGTDGKFGWSGMIDIFTNGGAVSEVRKMTVVCSASTAIEPLA